MDKKRYKVKGMSCAACVARVERAVGSLEGVSSCEVNLLLGTMDVLGDVSEKSVSDALERIGYTAYPDFPEDLCDEVGEESKREKRNVARRLISSSVLLITLMYISMGHVMMSLPMPAFIAKNPFILALCEAVLSSAILIINKRFFVSGFKAAVRLMPNMDTLVALGSFVSYVYSLVLLALISLDYISGDISTAAHRLHGLYFESAAMILVLITLGKLLETFAKGKTTSAIRSLMDLTPKTAAVIRDGEERVIAVSEIAVGDIFIVRRGENIATDGRIISGELSVDESTFSGESLPCDKSIGDSVFGGTSVLSGFAKIEAVKTAEKTAIAEIIRMVKDASGSKAPVAKAADKVAGVFVPIVILIALVTFAVWMLLDAKFGYALERAVSVLVISCPCALGLATPLSVMVGSGIGARHGILYKNATSLELSGKIDLAIFDKTGTVTEGKPEVKEIFLAEGIERDEFLSIAIAIEEKSEHPLARAVCREKDLFKNVSYPFCDDFKASFGGVSGIVGGRRVFAGNSGFIERCVSLTLDGELKARFDAASNRGETAIIFADEERILGVIAIADRIRDDSRLAIAELSKMGIEAVMVTGDNSAAAASVAERVGIKKVVSGALPADKAEYIKKARLSDKRVCMVGDGVNDSVALTEADVGIAVGKGTDIAIDSADVVLARVGLLGVVSAIKLGRRTLLNIYENLFWAFIYNVICIPLAAGVFIGAFGWTLKPMLGAFAMSISSLFVVTNALRLNFFDPTRASKREIGKATDFSDISVGDFESIRINQTEENLKEEEKEKMNNNVTLKIEGMMCPHCSGRVKAALSDSELVLSCEVSHELGCAEIALADGIEASDETVSALKNIVISQGYKVV